MSPRGSSFGTKCLDPDITLLKFSKFQKTFILWKDQIVQITQNKNKQSKTAVIKSPNK